MTSELDISTINIPYGVLHDSILTGVKCKNNFMTFSFDIQIYPEDYTNDFYKQYKKYDMCYITLDATKVKWKWY